MSDPIGDIISSSMADIDTGDNDSYDAGTDAVVEDATGGGETPEVVASTEPAAAAAVPAADDDISLVPDRDERGREHRIPKSRVLKMNEKAAREASAKLEANIRKMFGVGEADPLDYDGLGGKWTAAQERVAQMEAAERFMSSDADGFIDFLIAQMPDKYGKFRQQPQAPAAAPAPQPQAFALPEPDLDLGDGRRTYSTEGLQNLMKSVQAQARAEAVKEAEEKAEARFSERFGPIEQRHKQQQEAEAARKHKEMLETKAAEDFKEAQKLEGFTEHQKEILELFKSSPKMSLEGAYNRVVLPKLKANKEEIRKAIMAEMNAKPASTSSATGGAPPAKSPSDGASSIDDILWAAVKGK